MDKWPWLLVLVAGLNSTIGNILLKQSQNPNLSFVQSIFTIQFIGGVFFYGLNLLFFAFSLRYLEVSKAYPCLAIISFTSLLFLSMHFLNEPISTTKVIGIILALIGIIFIST